MSSIRQKSANALSIVTVTGVALVQLFHQAAETPVRFGMGGRSRLGLLREIFPDASPGARQFDA
jgi:hypothetical protein